MRLLISGGGTGGHVSPGLGVAKVWEGRFGKGTVAWAGRPGGVEEKMAIAAGLYFCGVEAKAFRRSLSLENLSLPWTLFKGLRAASRCLLQEDPRAVLVTGGFVGVPMALAAWRQSRPLVLLEPNAVPGLANRLLSPLARKVCLAYPGASVSFKGEVTGTPCRLTSLPERAAAARVFGLDPQRPTLLVMPGSQAAHVINLTLARALPGIAAGAPGWQFIWMCGPGDEVQCRRAVSEAKVAAIVLPFIDDVASAYAASDLVLCRSGAATLAELAVAGLPSVQVPYPYSAAGHQLANGRAFAGQGAAVLLEQRYLAEGSLTGTLLGLMNDDGARQAVAGAAKSLGRPRAAEAVADVLQALAA